VTASADFKRRPSRALIRARGRSPESDASEDNFTRADITMASLPLQPCRQPGCSTLCESGYCAVHRKQVAKRRDGQRGTPAERGYDADHRRLRVLCFIRDEWRCVDCGWEPNVVADCRRFELGPPPVDQVLAELRERFGRGERHLHADHEIPIEERPDLRLVLDNLRTRCNGCHSAKTMRESVNPIRIHGIRVGSSRHVG
jgi:5-methylcytosine-specific restriction enzyme A